MVQPKDFLLNTDYEMDRIIFAKTGDFTGSIDIQHGLGFAPLPFGVWSTDSNFTTVNTIGVYDSGSEPGYVPRLGVWCDAKDSTIHLEATGNGKDSTKIYYRLFAFEPIDDLHDISATSNLANKFILNTDYNYRKLKAAGTFTQSNQEYAHNLGYLPQVMVWSDFKNWDPDWGIEPVMSASNFTESKITITNNKIKAGRLLNGEKQYWRVYYDEA